MIIFADMKYRGIEYSVVQGLGRQVWKWSVSPGDNASLKGLAAIKSEAVEEAERAVDRARADVPRRGLRARPRAVAARGAGAIEKRSPRAAAADQPQ